MLAEITNAGWWAEYLSLLHDPAHIMLELTIMAVFDGLIGLILWPMIKNAVRRHDENEHGKPKKPGECIRPHVCGMEGPCNGFPRPSTTQEMRTMYDNFMALSEKDKTYFLSHGEYPPQWYYSQEIYNEETV